jgi:stage III sporulation protein AG
VVCQGGGSAEVRLAVTEAVAALTGLPADRVAVAKWQS